MKIRFSFSTRLSLYIICITAVLFIIAMQIIGGFSKRTIMEDTKKNATSMVKIVISDIETILANVEAAVQNSVWVAEEHKDDPDYLYKITEALVRDNPNIIGSTIAFQPYYFASKGEYYAPYTCKNADNTLQSFQLGNSDNDYPHQEWFLLPTLTKKPLWSEPYFDEGGAKVMMTTYSIPLIDKTGEVYAVITADVSLKNLTDIINNVKSEHKTYTMIVSRNGSFVAHPDTSVILKETLYSVITEFSTGGEGIVDGVMDGKSGFGELVSGGERDVCVYGPIRNGWSVLVLYKYEQVLKGVTEMNNIILIVMLLGLILLYVCCIIIIKRITKPIKKFSDYAIEISHGNLNAQLPIVKSNDEILTLHDSLDTMQTSLKQLASTTIAKERYENELHIARTIQFGMLAKDFPDFVNALLVPAKEVGGDLYDFIEKDGYLYFAIGDVSGKGLPAAFFMAVTKSALRLISGLGLKECEVVGQINNAIQENNPMDMFVTLFIGKLNLSNGHLEYCNAGHNPIVIVSPNGEAKYLQAKANLAVGLFADFPYAQESLDLEKGSRLILYTDGVTEAEDKDKNQYGEDKLIEYANATYHTTDTTAFTNGLLASVKEFTKDAEQNDDITIMTIDYGKKI